MPTPSTETTAGPGLAAGGGSPAPGDDALAAEDTPASWLRSFGAIWPWLVGLATGVAVMGRALLPGSLFSLDLVLTDGLPVPRGVWGIGPELPRRVPMFVPAAWLEPLLGGTLVVKLMIVAAIALAFVGTFRLVANYSRLAGVGAGLLFALSPFLLTRLAVGHLMIVLTMALLPWAYPVLLRPAEDIWRTFLWTLALAFTGNYGGLVSLILVVAGLVACRGRSWVRVGALWLAAQLLWLAPGLIVFAQGAGLSDATVFPTRAEGAVGYGEVLSGHGFWQEIFQVGGSANLLNAVLGVALLALAVIGTTALPATWRRTAAALAGLGLAVTLASAVPGVSSVYSTFSRNPLGGNLRESQRMLPLYITWMAPAAGLGAWRVALVVHGTGRSVARGALAPVVAAIPILFALALGAPGLFGVGGQLCPFDTPADWDQARRIVQQEPGTVVAFPWFGYSDVTLQSGTRSCGVHHLLNPWPIFLGGDVLVASDLRLSLDRQPLPERADPREPIVHGIADGIAKGQMPSDGLARVGARWVLFHRTGNYLPYEQVLDADPGLERVSAGKDVFLYRVRAWDGAAVLADGGAAAIDPVVEPLALLPESGAVIWRRPAAKGWLRGFQAAGGTTDGLLLLPAGSGPVWYWPTLVVLASYGVTGTCTVAALRARRRSRRAAAKAGTRATSQPVSMPPESEPDPIDAKSG